ncbi:hypothetical protein MON38_04140 [Hymenobacter sp. DH14]|uniref:DUF4148 domain-containing protein n=1 Tax=Hymenobacter cyanobacteriorum TaxID=2926463 RepID=A0A9X1VHL7_9BACT|nr:hypothetical protein [Hymenobacter cyanobacteriorum]MCI1186596.1 hypothetical protein [Hymenobacter cyanobacteriorum]
MKKSLFSSLAAFALLVAASSASAQTATPGVTVRQRHEQARIRQGVRSGELTRTEAARLKGREIEIRQDKRAAKADGVVTRDERQDLRKDERQASRAIYRQKHDGQVRR